MNGSVSTPKRKKHVLIIGAGFGGMSAAALLAKEGFRVTVVEKNSMPGGRAIVYKDKGFVFDMGPSWYLMPEVFEHYFSLFGRKPSDYYQLKRISPNYRLFFGGNKQLDVPSDLDSIYELFDRMEENGSVKLREYLKVCKYQYDIAMSNFMYREYRTIRDFFSWKLITEGLKLKVFESVDKFVSRYFTNPDLKKILEYTMVFLGGSPSNTPGLYAIMSHVDFELGVWYPDGGFGKLASAFEQIAKENGAEFIYDNNVKGIEVNNGIASGVKTEKGIINADIILSDADYHHTETELLSSQYRSYNENWWSRKIIGPSSFLVYLGLNKKINNLNHHNLYLDKSWDEHFRQIFDDPQWPDSPSYYICCPSKTDPTVAPEGKENLFLLVPVAPGLKDETEFREKYFDKIITHLEGLTGESIKDSIEVKRIFAHNDFKSYYNAYKGTALGMTHTLFQTAVFRPSHMSKRVKNLYYTGNYCHPGIGVPMVLISSQIVSREITDNG